MHVRMALEMGGPHSPSSAMVSSPHTVCPLFDAAAAGVRSRLSRHAAVPGADVYRAHVQAQLPDAAAACSGV